MAKYLDQAGLQILWDSIKQKFIDNEELESFLASYETIADLQRDYADRTELATILDGYATDEELISAINALSTASVKQKIESDKGKSLIFNEADGGGAKFEHNDNTWSFVGVNDGGKDGLAAQIYAVDSANNYQGSKLDVTTDGIYYTKGEESTKAASLRDVEANELATKKDIQALHIPEYGLMKEDDPGVYAAVYHLTKDGVNVGAAINIAKDQLLKSVEVKICEVKDTPISGLEVGDKYLDFTFIVEAGAEAHSYIAIKDMVRPYTAGEGIVITSENAITFDPEVISTVEYVDANISDTMNFIIQERDTEHAGRVAGDNLLDAKKVDKQMEGANGKALIFNESDGGGAKFENNNGVESFVGVNDGTNGIVAQIYADKMVNGKWQGAKLDVSNDGIYYTVGDKSAAERMVEDNLLATKAYVDAAEPDALTEEEILNICQ